MSYTGELVRAMQLCAAQPKAIFLGQGVGSPSTIQTDTLRGIPDEQRIEFPVAEDLQMGVATGMALDGWLPICVYPRWDFLLLAANQLVLHLDRIGEMSGGKYSPKVLIRVVAPSTKPFDPGPQHDGDHTEALRLMLRTIPIVQLKEADQIVPAYQRALDSKLSWILVEDGSRYDAVPSGVMK